MYIMVWRQKELGELTLQVVCERCAIVHNWLHFICFVVSQRDTWQSRGDSSWLRLNSSFDMQSYSVARGSSKETKGDVDKQ